MKKVAPCVPVPVANEEASRFKVGQIIYPTHLREVIKGEWQEDQSTVEALLLNGRQASLDQFGTIFHKNCPFFGELTAGLCRYRIREFIVPNPWK